TPLVVEAWRALGASTTPMNFEELFVALQLGTVDAQDNPLDLIYAANFYEVQDYVVLSQDTFTPWAFIVNDKLYNDMPAEIKEKFDTAFNVAKKYQNDLVAKNDDEYTKKLKEKGMEFIEPDRELFKEKLYKSDVLDKFKDKMAPNLIERVNDLAKG